MTDYPADMAGLETPVSASAAFAESSARVPALPAFDAARYRSEVEGFGLTDDQERELLETIWSIMVSFVDLGFRVDVCSDLLGLSEVLADDDSDTVQFPHSTTLENAASSAAEDGPV